MSDQRIWANTFYAALAAVVVAGLCVRFLVVPAWVPLVVGAAAVFVQFVVWRWLWGRSP